MKVLQVNDGLDINSQGEKEVELLLELRNILDALHIPYNSTVSYSPKVEIPNVNVQYRYKELREILKNMREKNII